jgi:hypothetical protein
MKEKVNKTCGLVRKNVSTGFAPDPNILLEHNVELPNNSNPNSAAQLSIYYRLLRFG